MLAEKLNSHIIRDLTGLYHGTHQYRKFIEGFLWRYKPPVLKSMSPLEIRILISSYYAKFRIAYEDKKEEDHHGK